MTVVRGYMASRSSKINLNCVHMSHLLHQLNLAYTIYSSWIILIHEILFEIGIEFSLKFLKLGLNLNIGSLFISFDNISSVILGNENTSEINWAEYN